MAYYFPAGPVLMTSGGGMPAAMGSSDGKRLQSSVQRSAPNPAASTPKAVISVPTGNVMVVGQQMYRPQLPPGAVFVPYPMMQATPNHVVVASPPSVPPPPSIQSAPQLPVYAPQPPPQGPPGGLVYYSPSAGGNITVAGYSVMGSNGNISFVAANGASPPVATPPTAAAAGSAVGNQFPVPLMRIGANGLPVANGGVMPPMPAAAVPNSVAPNKGLYSHPPPALPPQINPALFQNPPPPLIKPNGSNFTPIPTTSSNPFNPQLLQPTPYQQHQVNGPVFAYSNNGIATGTPLPTCPITPVILTNGSNVQMPPSPGVSASVHYNPIVVQQSAQRYRGPPIMYQQSHPPRPLA